MGESPEPLSPSFEKNKIEEFVTEKSLDAFCDVINKLIHSGDEKKLIIDDERLMVRTAEAGNFFVPHKLKSPVLYIIHYFRL